jgi:hypothetical protein
MRRGVIGLVVVTVAAIVLGACSGDDDIGASPSTTTGLSETTSAAPATTAVPASTSVPATTSTTVAPDGTTSVAPSTILPVPGTLALTRVVFGTDPYAVISNVGNEPVDLAGHWLVSGTMSAQLDPSGTGTIQPGRTAVMVLGGEPPPQFVGVQAVVDLGTALGSIDASGGELLLAQDLAPIDTDAVIDYVAWGTGPHLNLPSAVAARIWSPDASVELEPEAISIISPGTLGGGVEDWRADVGG